MFVGMRVDKDGRRTKASTLSIRAAYESSCAALEGERVLEEEEPEEEEDAEYGGRRREEEEEEEEGCVALICRACVT